MLGRAGQTKVVGQTGWNTSILKSRMNAASILLTRRLRINLSASTSSRVQVTRWVTLLLFFNRPGINLNEWSPLHDYGQSPEFGAQFTTAGPLAGRDIASLASCLNDSLVNFTLEKASHV